MNLNKNAKPLIEPVKRELILQELSEDKFLKNTSRGGNRLYIVNALNSPNIMQELGRLRELAFRLAGGGTGKALDIDYHDLATNGYQQLIVWDPVSEEIIGSYRFIICNKDNTEHLSTANYFDFSDKFKMNYLPYMLELGRSFVHPLYQTTTMRAKGIYALDNLWDGLGAIVNKNPHIEYFMGKVTMYKNYRETARNTVFAFLNKYFKDEEGLVIPKKECRLDFNLSQANSLFIGGDYKEDLKILTDSVREFGEAIPPLINSYMNLSPTMKVFGTILNNDFGEVEETGILVKLSDINIEKMNRYIYGK